jgi:hypothetical protein
MSAQYIVLSASYYWDDKLQGDACDKRHVHQAQKIWKKMYAYFWLQNRKESYHLEVPGVTV